MSIHRRYRVRGLREAAAFLALVLTTGISVALLVVMIVLHPGGQELGVTFSTQYARSLGMNPEEVFTAMVQDLGVKRARIPVYWNDVEKTPGVWNFSEIDSVMAIAADHHVEVTLVVGMKVPRWPECFIPSFLQESSEDALNAAVYRYVQAVTMHARQYSALVRWQVENEALFTYGHCPAPSLERLQKEVDLVRALDTAHPVLLTVSGEQEPWLNMANMADVVGVSMYRFAYNNVLGPVAFPYPPLYYRVHAMITRLFADDVIISELQMEPWFTGNPQDAWSVAIPFIEKDFVQHMEFVRQTGIREAFLWGAEWWYYQKIHGDSILWNVAKDVFSESR